MRSRFIKPGFFKNEELAELDPLGRILFAGLWCMADKAGRLEDRPRRIKAELLPYDNYGIEEALTWLARHGFIIRYQVDGARYIQIKNWKHQSPHHTEAGSTIPPYVEPPCDNVDDTSINGEVTVNSLLDNDTVLITSPVLLNTDTPPLIPPTKAKRASPKTPVPEQFELTDARIAFARKEGFRGDLRHLESVTKQFLDTHAAKGDLMADWGKAWQTWIRNSVAWGQDLPKGISNGSKPSTEGHRGAQAALRNFEAITRRATSGNLGDADKRNQLGPGKDTS